MGAPVCRRCGQVGGRFAAVTGLALPTGSNRIASHEVGAFSSICDACFKHNLSSHLVWLVPLPEAPWSLPATVRALRAEADRLACHLDAIDRLADMERDI